LGAPHTGGRAGESAFCCYREESFQLIEIHGSVGQPPGPEYMNEIYAKANNYKFAL
jgi:hypothetical protein